MEDRRTVASKVMRTIRNRPEQELEKQIRLYIGQQPDFLLWNNKRGGLDRNGQWRMTPGLCTGASDLIGIGPGGRFVALEIKAGKSRSNKQTETDQKFFLELVRKRGGFAARVTSMGEAIAAVERCRVGASE